MRRWISVRSYCGSGTVGFEGRFGWDPEGASAAGARNSRLPQPGHLGAVARTPWRHRGHVRVPSAGRFVLFLDLVVLAARPNISDFRIASGGDSSRSSRGVIHDRSEVTPAPRTSVRRTSAALSRVRSHWISNPHTARPVELSCSKGRLRATRGRTGSGPVSRNRSRSVAKAALRSVACGRRASLHGRRDSRHV
jgi:hypothetical protein